MKYKKQIFLGYDDRGKRIQKRVYANTRRELEEEIYKAKHQTISRTTFKDYADFWLETYTKNCSRSTYEYHKRIINNHASDLWAIRMDLITPSDIQMIINDNFEHPDLCRKIRSTLKQIFDRATADGTITQTPVKGLVLPKLKEPERRPLTTAEKNAIPVLALPEKHKMFVLILLYFGLRPGEALALTSDDFTESTLTIDKAIDIADNPTVKDTKTGAVRVLPIPSEVKSSLFCFMQGKYRLFTMSNGEIMSKASYRRFWGQINKEFQKHGSVDLHPYVFRYNYATMLYYSGISLKMAAYLMGHSDTSMLLKVYAQLDSSKEKLDVLTNMNFI